MENEMKMHEMIEHITKKTAKYFRVTKYLVTITFKEVGSFSGEREFMVKAIVAPRASEKYDNYDKLGLTKFYAFGKTYLEALTNLAKKHKYNC